jgi:hypothetical protein
VATGFIHNGSVAAIKTANTNKPAANHSASLISLRPKELFFSLSIEKLLLICTRI